MKKIKLVYNEKGHLAERYEDGEHYIAKGENNSIIFNVTFPNSLTGDVRAYVEFKGGGDVISCGIINSTTNTVEFPLSSDYLEFDYLKIGFEVVTPTKEIRFEPLELYVDNFVNISGKKKSTGYTVTVKVGSVTTLNADEKARVTNEGTDKDVVLNFEIPQGIQGPKGEKGDTGPMPELANNLTTEESGKTALDAYQGYLLKQLLAGKLDYTIGYEDELDTYQTDGLYKIVNDSSGTINAIYTAPNHPYYLLVTTTEVWLYDGVQTCQLRFYNGTPQNISRRILKNEWDNTKNGYYPVWSDWESVVWESDIKDFATITAINEKISAIGQVKKYGARRDKNSSSPALTRIWDAEGLTAKAGVDDTVVTNDFDSIYPWSHMKRCNISIVNDKVVINAYEGEPAYAVDGSNGQVAVEIPEFYYCPPDIEGDEYEVFGVSEFPIGGWHKSPKMYVGAYTASFSDDKSSLQSVSGKFNAEEKTREQYRALARATDSLCGLTDIQYINALQTLFTVEFATLNSQSIMCGATGMNVFSSHTAQVTEAMLTA